MWKMDCNVSQTIPIITFTVFASHVPKISLFDLRYEVLQNVLGSRLNVNTSSNIFFLMTWEKEYGK